MNVKSSDVYLNTLCLTAYAPGSKSTTLAKAVVKMFDDTAAEEKVLMRPINILYVDLLREVINGTLNLSNRAEVSDILLKYTEDPTFRDCKFQFDELKNLLTPETPVSTNRVKQLFDRVRQNIMLMQSNRALRRMLKLNRQGEYEADLDKQKRFLDQLVADADNLRNSIKEAEMEGDEDIIPIDEIDMNDPESISKALIAKKKKDDGSRIKFGWQGFNRMFGPKQSASYGEMFACAARSHNYKSGLLMDIARWICTLNKPPDTGGLTPIVLFISLENEVQENLLDWYNKLYVNVYHKDPGALTNEEIVEYLTMRFNKNGFRLIAKRRMGENFGYREYEKMIEEEEKKYSGKVVASVLDYITLCKRCPEDASRNDAVQLQKMAERFHNHSAHNSIFFATGLQLETNASQLAASGKHNVVKQFNEFHLADCRGLKRELDMLVFINIENNHHGIPYLTFALNKHRYVNDTPNEDKYTAYKFTPLGILDDINGPDMSVKDIFADDPDEDPGEISSDILSVF